MRSRTFGSGARAACFSGASSDCADEFGFLPSLRRKRNLCSIATTACSHDMRERARNESLVAGKVARQRADSSEQFLLCRVVRRSTGCRQHADRCRCRRVCRAPRRVRATMFRRRPFSPRCPCLRKSRSFRSIPGALRQGRVLRSVGSKAGTVRAGRRPCFPKCVFC